MDFTADPSFMEKVRTKLGTAAPKVPCEYPSGLRNSAVLVTLYPVNNKLHFVLTHRNSNLKKHAGEVSFPGGKFEPASDKTPIDTALREASEEIGLDPSLVEILGTLDPFITLTGFLITPVVGMIKEKTEFVKNGDEVARILVIPLDFFADSRNFTEKCIKVGEIDFPVYYYRYEDESGSVSIWGATAHIIVEFLEKVFGIKLATMKRPPFTENIVTGLLEIGKKRYKKIGSGDKTAVNTCKRNGDK